jgi:hypothetical protein
MTGEVTVSFAKHMQSTCKAPEPMLDARNYWKSALAELIFYVLSPFSLSNL